MRAGFHLQEEDEGAVAFLRQRVRGQRLEQRLARVFVDGLRQALGQLGQVDDGSEVSRQPFLPGCAPKEAAQGDEPARPGSGGERPALAP
jgi:hypothetical protein